MDRLSEKMDRANLENLFQAVNVNHTGQTVSFESYDEIFLHRIRVLFGEELDFILREGVGGSVDVQFNIVERRAETAPREKENGHILTFDKEFSFSNFVIGRSNEMAYSAALAVAQSYGKSIYNPLFIYGDSGLGKTHLMQAIGNKVYQYDKNVKCSYVTADQFRNELIEAIRNRTTEAFRDKYRNVDVLLIDDIHVIEKSEAVQEEFFHTFNDLYKLKRQIVITSDRPPADINIEKRLITRFEWGLVTDIRKPELETRVAILRKKAEDMGVEIDPELMFFIGENVTSNVRKLEGCLRRIKFYKKISNNMEKLGRNDITALLSEFFDNNLKDMSVENIKKQVALYFNMTVKMLEGKRRNQEVVLPRFIAMYLSRRFTNDTLQAIGQAFGGRDHAAVINACNKIEGRMKEDIVFRNEVDKVISFLNNGGFK
ncbi:MAG TPA: chromosomal replication initiator protein DnaA [Candidatus Mcinerneyibacteriales bacterium]|nr:chromosomal replication initiator protein DnaA [Candidatus Mcinerneyibacteriales bacterium]